MWHYFRFFLSSSLLSQPSPANSSSLTPLRFVLSSLSTSTTCSNLHISGSYQPRCWSSCLLSSSHSSLSSQLVTIQPRHSLTQHRTPWNNLKVISVFCFPHSSHPCRFCFLPRSRITSLYFFACGVPTHHIRVKSISFTYPFHH